MVTAGPTHEPVDAVRFLGNRSSGRMGFAVAAEAARRGARVMLVTGPVALAPPYGVDVVRVETAAEMASAVASRFEDCDAVVMAAAVADFRPVGARADKIKKEGGPPPLELEPTEDILAGLGKRKGRQVLVGFAAETTRSWRRGGGSSRRRTSTCWWRTGWGVPGPASDRRPTKPRCCPARTRTWSLRRWPRRSSPLRCATGCHACWPNAGTRDRGTRRRVRAVGIIRRDGRRQLPVHLRVRHRGHPDKLADQISDAVLDAILSEDPDGRVACETLVTTGVVFVAGEISTKIYVDIPRVVRDTILGIGYTDATFGIDGATCGVIVAIQEQSPDIALGVDKSSEAKHGVPTRSTRSARATRE